MKKPKQLPPVDPEFLIVEQTPGKLDAYARGLLSHLRDIRSGGKAQGYPITKIKAAAVWLIQSYSAARAVPATEAAELIREIVQADRRASTSPVRRSSEGAYRAAIAFEAKHPSDKTGKAPSTASLYSVACHIRQRGDKELTSQKTAEGVVRGWRRLKHYRANVALQRPGDLRVKT
jgi:hypothetical protein